MESEEEKMEITEKQEDEEEKGPLQKAIFNTQRMLFVVGSRKEVKYLLFIFAIALDTTDCVTDWLLYNDVRLLDRGLVYGRVGTPLKSAFLAFCIIGTFIYALELLNHFVESCTQHTWFLPGDWTSILTIWLEDLPQAVLSVTLAACHEYAVSFIQIFKAAILVISFVFRLGATITRYVTEDRVCQHKDKQCYHKVKKTRRRARGLLITGIILQLVCAFCIFQFTFVQTHKGYMEFRTINGFFTANIDPHRYFNDVNIFLNRSDLKLPNNNRSQINQFVKLCSLYDVINSQKQRRQVDVSLQSYKSGDKYRLSFTKEYDSANGTQLSDTACFEGNSSLNFTSVNCTTMPRTNIIRNFSIHLEFVPPAAHLLFGDVYYKLEYTSDVVMTTVNMRYYRISEDNSTLLQPITEGYGFYDSSDMQDIYQIWKTGFMSCDTTGEEGPQHKSDLNV